MFGSLPNTVSSPGRLEYPRRFSCLRYDHRQCRDESREIAIRLALGAQRRNILRMFLRQGLTLAAAGTGVGLVGALIVSHLMAGLLFGVSPNDLTTFAGVTLVLTTVALTASNIPALRAMRVDR
jgi:putative ABC transport system permease protein